MRDERALVFLLHSVVRGILLNPSVDDPYLAIVKSIYPCAVRGEFIVASRGIDQRYLQGLCDYIYALDKREASYSSCYSASVVVQLIAFVHGITSEMLLGVKKQDKKIAGHAWVEIHAKPMKYTITPGGGRIDDSQVIKRINPDEIIQSWVEEKCDLG